MTLVSEIILDAFRQSNLIAITVDPTEAQQTEALRHLNRIVKSVFGVEVGEPLHDTPYGDFNDVYFDTVLDTDTDPLLEENSRLVVSLSQPHTVYLPARPQDGARFAVVDAGPSLAANPLTIEGNGRLIEGGSSLVIAEDLFTGEWFYRADKGSWMKINPLELTDPFPFSSEFDIFFITLLAMYFNPAYGTSMNDMSLTLYQQAKSRLRQRYAHSAEYPPEAGSVFLPNAVSDRRHTSNWSLSLSMFRRGRT